MNNSATPPFNVWLIEDNLVYASALMRAIDQMECILEVRQFRSCEAAIRAVEQAEKGNPPEVVLLDVGLPGMSGIQGIPVLKQHVSKLQIIILTVFDDADKVFQAICAGADGYLLKGSNFEGIQEAMLEVRAGGAPMNGRIAKMVLRQFAQQPPPRPDYGLTQREREILEALVRGLTKKEIAAELQLSIHTADFHLRHIYEKLHVNTRTGAVAIAIRDRLT